MGRYFISTAKCTGCTRPVGGRTPSGDTVKATDAQGRCPSCVKYDKPVLYTPSGRIIA